MDINFNNFKKIIYNDTELDFVYAVVKKGDNTSLPKLLWSKEEANIVTFTFSYAPHVGYDRVTETIKLPKDSTWRWFLENDSRFFTTAANDMIFHPNSTKLSFWVASTSQDFISANDTFVENEHYFLVVRTKDTDEDELKYSPLKLGDNTIVIKADEPNFYFFAKESGTYVFTASSDNAYIGYEEKLVGSDGEEYSEPTWVEGTSFKLNANVGDVLYIVCSNQDFSNETYTLNIAFNKED